MTNLNADPRAVSMVLAASSLPMFLLHLSPCRRRHFPFTGKLRRRRWRILPMAFNPAATGTPPPAPATYCCTFRGGRSVLGGDDAPVAGASLAGANNRAVRVPIYAAASPSLNALRRVGGTPVACSKWAICAQMSADARRFGL